jgi:hypothetical protein
MVDELVHLVLVQAVEIVAHVLGEMSNTITADDRRRIMKMVRICGLLFNPLVHGMGDIIAIHRVRWSLGNNTLAIPAGTTCSMGPSQYHVAIIYDLENSIAILLGLMTHATVPSSILEGLVECKLVAFKPNLVSLGFGIRVVNSS